MSSFVARLVEVAIEEREKFVAESQAECDVLEKELISINEQFQALAKLQYEKTKALNCFVTRKQSEYANIEKVIEHLKTNKIESIVSQQTDCVVSAIQQFEIKPLKVLSFAQLPQVVVAPTEQNVDFSFSEIPVESLVIPQVQAIAMYGHSDTTTYHIEEMIVTPVVIPETIEQKPLDWNSIKSGQVENKSISLVVPFSEVNKSLSKKEKQQLIEVELRKISQFITSIDVPPTREILTPIVVNMFREAIGDPKDDSVFACSTKYNKFRECISDPVVKMNWGFKICPTEEWKEAKIAIDKARVQNVAYNQTTVHDDQVMKLFADLVKRVETATTEAMNAGQANFKNKSNFDDITNLQNFVNATMYRNKYLGLLLCLCSSLRVRDLQMMRVRYGSWEECKMESQIVGGKLHVTDLSKKPEGDQKAYTVEICLMSPVAFVSYLGLFRGRWDICDEDETPYQLWDHNNDGELNRYLTTFNLDKASLAKFNSDITTDEKFERKITTSSMRALSAHLKWKAIPISRRPDKATYVARQLNHSTMDSTKHYLEFQSAEVDMSVYMTPWFELAQIYDKLDCQNLKNYVTRIENEKEFVQEEEDNDSGQSLDDLEEDVQGHME